MPVFVLKAKLADNITNTKIVVLEAQEKLPSGRMSATVPRPTNTWVSHTRVLKSSNRGSSTPSKLKRSEGVYNNHDTQGVFGPQEEWQYAQHKQQTAKTVKKVLVRG